MKVKSTDIFKTTADLRPYVGEKWVDDDGYDYTLLRVKGKLVFYDYSDSGEEDAVNLRDWLLNNNLPHSLRVKHGLEIKPRGLSTADSAILEAEVYLEDLQDSPLRKDEARMLCAVINAANYYKNLYQSKGNEDE